MRAVLGGTGPAFTRSKAEDLFLALVRRARVHEPEANVSIGGYEVDFYWPRERLALEMDGRAFHTSRRDFERDRRRDADLATRGIRVLGSPGISSPASPRRSWSDWAERCWRTREVADAHSAPAATRALSHSAEYGPTIDRATAFRPRGCVESDHKVD